MTRPELLVLTEEEADFGFQHLIVESDGVEADELRVAYVVSDSDIITKAALLGEIGYKHLRWGVMRYPKIAGVIYPPEDNTPKWHPLGMGLYHDPGEAIQRAQYEPDEQTLAPIERHKFKWEVYDMEKHGE